MSTEAQIAANRANAKHSTGPTTESGKVASSQNGITLGLYSRRDFIRPEEETEYAQLQADLNIELRPAGVMEKNLVNEIRRAMWRLHRCGEVESNLVLRLGDGQNYVHDPMETGNANADRIQRSVDRARSQAHRLLHKCTAELRRIQTDRQIGVGYLPEGVGLPDISLTDWRAVAKAEQLTKRTQSEAPAKSPVVEMTNRTQSETSGTPRNALCPCNSGKKHKRCCGQDAPPVLHAA